MRPSVKNLKKKVKLCVIQQQVPLLLPCVNFAQITTPSFTNQQYLFQAYFKQKKDTTIKGITTLRD